MAKSKECVDFSKYLEYDVTSPSCLRWKIDIRTGKGGRRLLIQIGDYAGCFMRYWRVRLNGKYYQAHRIIYALYNKVEMSDFIIDHIDGDGSNNKIENLRIASCKINSRNQKRHSRNSSGIAGVYFQQNDHGGLFAVSEHINLEGQKIRKFFNINKLGIMVAFRDAVIHRAKMIEELNNQGAGYTERHGK